jgi:hypothetical protein
MRSAAFAHSADLAARKAGTPNHFPKAIGRNALEVADGADCVTKILACHQVGEIIVIHERAVFVRAGNSVDADASALALGEEAEVAPKACRHLCHSDLSVIDGNHGRRRWRSVTTRRQ